MLKLLRSLAISASLLLFTHAAISETLPSGAKPMTDAEVTALYSGKTKVFTHSSMYFAPDHTMIGAAQGKPIKGTWSVSSNQLCLQTKGGGKDCWKWWSDNGRPIALWAVRSYGPKSNPTNDFSSEEAGHLQAGDSGSASYKDSGGK
jgi:Protein of unknown function (DUF995)